jgi:outer membrane protein assembly factor BamD (BamD/ComL family)
LAVLFVLAGAAVSSGQEPVSASSPETVASNLNVRVRTPDIEFPVVLKFKGFRLAEDLPFGMLIRTNVLNRTNVVTNRGQIRSSASTNAVRTAKKKKKKSEEDKLLEQGTVLFRNGEYESASARFRELAALAPDSPQADSGRIFLSRIRFASNDLPAALKELDGVVGRKNESSYWRITFLAARTNDSAAVAAYERLKQDEDYDSYFCEAFLAVRPSFLRKKIGNSLIRDGERFLGDPDFIGPKDRLLFGLGDLYEKDRTSRDMKKAHGFYTRVIEMYPKSPYAANAARRAEYIRKNFLEIR